MLGLLLAACDGSDSPNPIDVPIEDPDPEFDFDIIVFRVITLEAAAQERLRWIGTFEGPLQDSPEQTRRPWIGYGRGFRVEWKAYSKDSPIIGTQYRASQSEFGPWLPADNRGNPEWGQVSEFLFENLRSALQLEGVLCPEGPDCESQLRFDSGRHRLEVLALTRDGRELDAGMGRLEFEINYPPTVEFITDPASGPDDPAASPVAFWTLRDGTTRHVYLAAGDTVPSGATVRVRLRGQDRLRSTSDTDSFCCDELIDASGTAISFHAFTKFYRVSIRGVADSLFTLFGPTAPDSVLSMPLGPFDYEAAFRARDEHGRRGESVSFRFVSGYPPLEPTTEIPDAGRALLHPGLDLAGNEVTFDRITGQTLGWDPQLQDWSEDPDLATRFTGTWFEIPLRFRGDPDPRVVEVSEDPPANASQLSDSYSDHVRSFMYEIIHENDPENEIGDGPGDRPELFFNVDVLGSLDLEGDRAWRVFVPDLMFTDSGLFDPAGDCINEDFCAVGAWLRARLGDLEIRVRSRTSGYGSVFHQESPRAARDLIIDLAEFGRISPQMVRHFSVRLAMTDSNDQVIGFWPPEQP
jgi:hypothetical protein